MEKRGCLSKKSQMQLSFGMIFSIILIIVFIAFAFYGIKKFLEIRNSMLISSFIDSLQDKIDSAWKGPQISQKEDYSLPKKVEYACFVDFSSAAIGAKKDFYNELKRVSRANENLAFYPIGSVTDGFESFEIEHIDIEKTAKDENPFCIANDGKVKMIIKKEHEENLVTITRQE